MVSEGEATFFALALMFLGAIGSGSTSCCVVRDHYREEAVRRGAATWEVHEDGSTEFKWLMEPKDTDGE